MANERRGGNQSLVVPQPVAICHEISDCRSGIRDGGGERGGASSPPNSPVRPWVMLSVEEASISLQRWIPSNTHPGLTEIGVAMCPIGMCLQFTRLFSIIYERNHTQSGFGFLSPR
jgi:hypothetical protein